MKISLENLYVDIGAQRVNKGPFIQVHLIHWFTCTCLKLPPSKLITEMLRFSFIPGLSFFFSFFLHFKLIIIHYFTQKQWKRIKTEPQHRHEKNV